MFTISGHAHAPSIKSWVEEVDETYKDFSTRMDKYRHKLEGHLGTFTHNETNFIVLKTQKKTIITKFLFFFNLGIPSIQDPLSLDNASITSTDSGHVSISTAIFKPPKPAGSATFVFCENDFTHLFVYFSFSIFCSFQVTASSRLSSTSEATSTNSNNLQVINAFTKNWQGLLRGKK